MTVASHAGARGSRSKRWWSAGLVVALLALGVGTAWQRGNGSEPPASGAPKPSTASFAFGTYQRLFAADSPWNARPVGPKFGSYVIPKSQYFPAVADGAWSTGVFLARDGDPSVVVKGKPGTPGLWDPDSGQLHDVTIPRWPAEVSPAAESDGHAEIVDPTVGVVHSFWQLKRIDGQWTAALYSWSPLAGRGWGDPAHFYQGARAAAVPSSGGLIRRHEVDDGDTMYRHALAMSMTYNGLSADPTYVFPATSADEDAATTNKGAIPEGALLMLPPDFDTAQIETPSLRKIAETLKTFGAYVVDRNLGTPYSFYVEIGSGFDLHKHGWNNPAAKDLDTIRLGMRQVTSTDGWMDGDGKRFTPERNLNLLSMRGPWRVASGKAGGSYDTWKQAVRFDAGSTDPTVLVNDSGQALHPLAWSGPTPGTTYRIAAIATGGARLRVQQKSKADGKVLYDSGELADGRSSTLKWVADAMLVTYAIGGPDGPSSVRGTMLATP